MTFRIFLIVSLLFAFSIAGCSQKTDGDTKPLKTESNAETLKANSNTEPLQVGATAPDFTLTSSKNEKITLSEADKLTVLVFYRGYW